MTPKPKPCRSSSHQNGTTMLTTLLMLSMVALLSLTAAQITLLGAQASNNDRDRKIAFLAAEAALMDAQQDITQSPRSNLFSSDDINAFPTQPGCRAYGNSIGLCLAKPYTPIWKTIDFEDINGPTVTFGQFTQRHYAIGASPLPARLPRYIIERITLPTTANNNTNNIAYHITAIGFGPSPHNQVLLQKLYQIHTSASNTSQQITHRHLNNWREIINWAEQRHATKK